MLATQHVCHRSQMLPNCTCCNPATSQRGCVIKALLPFRFSYQPGTAATPVLPDEAVQHIAVAVAHHSLT
jgi:hypothetical protein